MSTTTQTFKSGLPFELSQLAIAASLCLVSASALAQTAPEATLGTVTVQDSAVPFKVDSAPSAKFTAPLRETPKSVQVISEEVIKQTGAVSLQDALKASPGITFGAGEGGSASGDRPFMRGSDAQSSIFVDGLRDIAPSAREVFNLESVEVIKGADSAYAGRGGAGGSINLTTKKAKNENFISGDVGVGTDSYKRATLDGNWKLGETTAFRLNAMAHDADVAGRNGPENQRWGIAPTVTFGMNTPDRLTLSLQHLQTDNVPDGGIPFNNRAAADAPKTGLHTIKPNNGGNRENWYGRDGLDMQKERSDVLTAEYEHLFSDTSKLRNALRYTNSSQEYIYAQPDDSQGSLVNDRVFRRYNTRASTTSTWQNVTEFTGESVWAGKRNRYAFGAELAHEASEYGTFSGSGFSGSASKCSAGTVTANCASLSNPNHMAYTGTLVKGAPTNKYQSNTIALYGFDTIDLNDKWLLNTGLRLDHYRTHAATTALGGFDRSDTLLNYQLGVVYKLTPQGNLYASIGSASTPGNANLGLDGDASIVNDPGARRSPISNANKLAPEKTQSIEFGTKWDLFNNHLGVNAAIFRNQVTNARVLDSTTKEASMVGEKEVNGFELGLNGQLLPSVAVSFGYTFMDSTQKNIGKTNGNPTFGTGLAFPGTPKHSASLWATYKPMQKLTLGLGANAQSSMVASYGTVNNAQVIRQVSGYTRFDAMASYVINPNVTFQLNVVNLADKVYYASANSPHYATPGAGRSAVASLKFNY